MPDETNEQLRQNAEAERAAAKQPAPTAEPTFSLPTETVFRDAQVLVADRPGGGRRIAIVDNITGHAYAASLDAEPADQVAAALRTGSDIKIASPADLAKLEGK